MYYYQQVVHVYDNLGGYCLQIYGTVVSLQVVWLYIPTDQHSNSLVALIQLLHPVLLYSCAVAHNVQREICGKACVKSDSCYIDPLSYLLAFLCPLMIMTLAKNPLLP